MKNLILIFLFSILTSFGFSQIQTPDITTVTATSALVSFQDYPGFDLYYKQAANSVWNTYNSTFGIEILFQLPSCTDFDVKIVDPGTGDESPIVSFTTSGNFGGSQIPDPVVSVITPTSAQVSFQDYNCLEFHYKASASSIWSSYNSSTGFEILFGLVSCTDYDVKLVDPNNGMESSTVTFSTLYGSSQVQAPTVSVITNTSAQVSFQDYNCLEFHYKASASSVWLSYVSSFGIEILYSLAECTAYDAKLVDPNSGMESSTVTFTTTGNCTPVSGGPAIDGFSLPISAYPAGFNTDNEALVYFDIYVGSLAYQVEYWDVNDPGVVYQAGAFSPVQSINLTGLNECTSYEWRVRVEVSIGVFTDWSEVYEFTTTGISCCGEVLDFEDFNVWGIWNDNGIDAWRITNNTVCNSSPKCLALRDNTNTSRSRSDAIDLSYCASVRIDFVFRFSQMNMNRGVKLHFFNGYTWKLIEYIKRDDADYFNNEFYEKSYILDAATYGVNNAFDTDCKFQFRSFGTNNARRTYIDDVRISCCDAGTQLSAERLKKSKSVVKQTQTVRTPIEFSVFPNPASDWVTLSLDQNKIDRLQLFDATGRLVRDYSNSSYKTRFDLSQLNNGIYLLKVISGDLVGTQKLIINK